MYVSKDLAALCEEMLEGTTSLADYLKSFRRRMSFAAFAIDDPLPALVDFPLALWRWGFRGRPIHFRTIKKEFSTIPSVPATVAIGCPESSNIRPQ